MHLPSRVGSVQYPVRANEVDSSSGRLVDFMFLFASTQSVTTGRTPGANAPLGLLAAPRTLVSLRRAHLVRVAFVCTAPMQLLRCPSAASADGSGVDSDAADIQSTVMRGVLQVDKGVTWPSSIPRGSKAIVTMRVIGRNSKGPLATLALPIDAFPLDFTISRRDLRDVPDFVWASEDLYVKADVVTPDGRVVAVGRSKSKCVDSIHGIAYVTLE